MSYLLDTCAVSELRATHPNRNVVQTLLGLSREDLYFSSITIGEIQVGIDLAPSPARKLEYKQWLEQSILAVFSEQIIPLDLTVARRWGSLVAALKKSGKRMQTGDSLIAATALTHDLTVVTRNEDDFAPAGVRIFNPWKQS